MTSQTDLSRDGVIHGLGHLVDEAHGVLVDVASAVYVVRLAEQLAEWTRA